MSIFVFLGPSLDRKMAAQLLAATYLPPVAMGDIYNLVRHSAKAGDSILIIDGVFEQVPAVWHKEIMYALASGIHVYGASSMGALRAAELYTFGMCGIGKVFECYQSGLIIDDDEVAVVHGSAEAGYRSLSEAMVNIRSAVQEAELAKVISSGLAEFLIEQAKARFYPERSWPELLKAIHASHHFVDELPAFKNFLQQRKPNQKREDAITALNFLRENTREEPYCADFDLEETSFWIGLTRTAGQQSKVGEHVTVDALHLAAMDYLKTRNLRWEEYRWKGLVRRLIDCLGDDIKINAAEYQKELTRFCRGQDIHSNADLQSWLDTQKLSSDDFKSMIEARTKVQVFMRQQFSSIEYFAANESKIDNMYGEALGYAGQMMTCLKQLGIVKPSLDSVGVDADQLQAWYEQKIQKPANFSEEHIANMGFSSVREFVNQILKQYLYETLIAVR